MNNQSVNLNVTSNNFKYTQTLYKTCQTVKQYINELIIKFNQWIRPNSKHYKQDEPLKHRILLELIDKKCLCKFYEIKDVQDEARIKSISNAASSWLDAVSNNVYGQKHSSLAD